MDKPEFCPYCGQKATADAASCSGCGRLLSAPSAPGRADRQAVTIQLPKLKLGSTHWRTAAAHLNPRLVGVAAAVLVVLLIGIQFSRSSKQTADIETAARITVSSWSQLSHTQFRNDAYQISNQQDNSASIRVQAELQSGPGTWVESAAEFGLTRIADQWLTADPNIRFVATPNGQATAQAAQVQGAATAQAGQIQSQATAQAAQAQAVAASGTAQAGAQGTAVAQRNAAATSVAVQTAAALATSTQVAASATQQVVAQATQQAAAQATTVATLKLASAQDISALVRAALGTDNPLLVGRTAQTNEYSSAQDFVISKDGWPNSAANIQQAIIGQLQQLQFQRVIGWTQPQVNTDPESLLIQIYVLGPGGPAISTWNDYLLSEDQADVVRTFGQNQVQRQLPISEVGQNGYLLCALCTANNNQSRFYYGFAESAGSGQSQYFVHMVGANVGYGAANRNGPGPVEVAQTTARAVFGALGRS